MDGVDIASEFRTASVCRQSNPINYSRSVSIWGVSATDPLKSCDKRGSILGWEWHAYTPVLSVRLHFQKNPLAIHPIDWQPAKTDEDDRVHQRAQLPRSDAAE